MRRLAIWAYAFAAGIFLAQYLLPPDWLLACGAAALVLAWSALLLPRQWRKRVLLAGGVASSALFREMVTARVAKLDRGVHVYFGRPEYSGDNAVGAARIGAKLLRAQMNNGAEG